MFKRRLTLIFKVDNLARFFAMKKTAAQKMAPPPQSLTID
jgi:hypothetical protein